jgi:glycosyltransferase involved in cell wall biosynthesis
MQLIRKNTQKIGLISVIMPVYNEERYLDNSIKSILKQTYQNLELLVINDNSNDNTLKVAQKYTRDPRVRIFTIKKKIGIAKCLNFGIKKSNGFYIARMDADDFSYPSRLEIQMDFLKKNSSLSLVGSQAQYFGKINYFSKLVCLNSNDCKSLIIFRNPFIHSSILIKKRTLKLLGGYKNYYKCEDYQLWSSLFFSFKAANIKKKLIKYRIHANQNGKDDLKKKKYVLLIQKTLISKLFNNFTNYDLLTHYNISTLNEKFTKQKKFNKINIYYKWLISLKKKNEYKKIFDVRSFNKIVDMYAVSVCLSFSNYGLVTHKLFKKYSFFSKRKLINFFLIILCLFKIDNFYLKKFLWYVIQLILIK